MSRIRNFVILNLVIVTYSNTSLSQICGTEFINVEESAPTAKNILYDVTESVNNFSRFQSGNHSGIESYVDSSSYLYYRIEIGNDVNYWLSSPQYQMVGVSFIVKPCKRFFETLMWSQVQQHLNYFVLHELYPPETVIYRVNGNKSAETCFTYCPEDEDMIVLYRFILEVKSEISSIGLEYNERFIDCCGKRYPFILQGLQVAILKIQFESPLMLLSYSFYVKRLNYLSERNKMFWKEINSNCLLYLKVEFPTNSHLQEFSHNEINIYRAYISKYASSWTSKYGDNKTSVIIDSYPETITVTPFGQQIYQNIHPVLQFASSYVYRPSDYNEVNIPPCQFRKIAETVGRVARNLHLDYYNIVSFSSVLFECQNNDELIYSQHPTFPDLHITSNFESVKSALQIITLIEKHSGGIYRVKSIYFKNDPPLHDSPSTELFWRFMIQQNINVGCSADIIVVPSYLEIVMDLILQKCDLVFQRSPLLLLNWPYGLEINDLWALNIFLEDSLNVRTAFQKLYPQGKVILQPNVRDLVLKTDESITKPEKRVNIYCEETLENTFSYNEIIATWAQIHNFTVNLGRVVDAAERGMWHKVYTDSELNRTTTDFVVLVRRNVPETIDNSIQFPYSYMCLHHTLLPNSEIQFDTNQFAGITFATTIKNALSPNTAELQTLLLYCFGRFANVEVRALHAETFGYMQEVLTREFVNVLHPQLEKVEHFQLYLETNIKTLLNDVLTHESILPMGIHLSGWENQTFDENMRMFSALESYLHKQPSLLQMEFGLSAKNCLLEMNLNLKNLKALSNLTFIKYIVCNVKPVLPTNVNELSMQIFFDTNFYVQEYLTEKLGLDVIFRLNFVSNKYPIEKADITNYLRFLNDTNQHAKAYGVKYFMGEAFNTANGKYDLSWWQISDFTDLANDEVYTELESEYFGRETKRKLQINLPLTKLLKDYTLIIGISVLSFLLVGIVLGVIMYYRKMRNAFLTKAEVYAFRNGIQKNNVSEDIQLYDIIKHEVDTQPFHEKFEISKDNIQLGNIVGRGNFGIVYKATFDNSTTVAVKTPPPDCSKEIFKTMLAEIKVLCFIGKHPNILRFIGGYTKEIEKGFIYIVTEFCEVGSLEKYLRSRKVTNATNYESSSEDESSMGYVANAKVNQTVDMNDLYRFSYEIANGMSYLSRRKVIHADLSTRNVLLTGELVCKIGDFGLSRKLYNKDKYVKQSDEELPWKWMAIESLKKMEFTTKSDVWSFGVTLWEIFTLGDVPYHGFRWTEDFNQKLENGLRLSKPPLASEETYSKMLQCWNISPDKRPQFFSLSSYFFEKLE